jgi:hypothetical protein
MARRLFHNANNPLNGDLETDASLNSQYKSHFERRSIASMRQTEGQKCVRVLLIYLVEGSAVRQWERSSCVSPGGRNNTRTDRNSVFWITSAVYDPDKAWTGCRAIWMDHSFREISFQSSASCSDFPYWSIGWDAELQNRARRSCHKEIEELCLKFDASGIWCLKVSFKISLCHSWNHTNNRLGYRRGSHLIGWCGKRSGEWLNFLKMSMECSQRLVTCRSVYPLTS